MDSSPSPLPNPVAYLNYLDPTIAFNYEVTRNVYFATLGVSHSFIIYIMVDDVCSTGFRLGHFVQCPARLEAAVHQQASTCVYCLSSLEAGSFSSESHIVNFCIVDWDL